MWSLKAGIPCAFGALIATTAVPMEPWTKLAIDVPLVVIIAVLLLKAFPRLMEQHAKQLESLSQKQVDASSLVGDGMGKLAEEVKGLRGDVKQTNDRLIQMLISEQSNE